MRPLAASWEVARQKALHCLEVARTEFQLRHSSVALQGESLEVARDWLAIRYLYPVVRPAHWERCHQALVAVLEGRSHGSTLGGER